MAHHDRWFVVPVFEFEKTDESGNVIETHNGPKYSDTDGLGGFSGNTHHFAKADYPGSLPFRGETMFIVRFYGSDAALDYIESQPDAFGKQEYGLSDAEVAGYLNKKFKENRTFTEWINGFGVSV